MADVQAQLKEHLQNAKDWGKMETPIPGVSVVKVPKTKSRPSLLFLEINPLKDDGSPMKRKGLFVGDREMLIKFAETMQSDKVYHLIGEIEQVNPDRRKGSSGATKKLEM